MFLQYINFIVHLHSQKSREDSVAQQVEHPALREGPGFLEKLKLIQ